MRSQCGSLEPAAVFGENVGMLARIVAFVLPLGLDTLAIALGLRGQSPLRPAFRLRHPSLGAVTVPRMFLHLLQSSSPVRQEVKARTLDGISRLLNRDRRRFETASRQLEHHGGAVEVGCRDGWR
jgi:hypothetical protein